MNPFRRALLRLRAILGHRALESDMQDEMREHLERATERLIARGMAPAAARLEARREFGNVTVIQEDARDARGARWIDALAADLRFALRYFARQKLTAATIVAVLALGIGANTVIFTMFQAELVRPAPAVPEDDAHVRIYALQRTDRSPWQGTSFSQAEMSALAARKETFETVAGWIAHEVVFDAGDSTGARGVEAQFVTPNFFAALGIALAAGPGFTRDTSDDADMTAIMAFAVAEQMYGDPRSAVGRRILVNELPLRVVGVAPPAFQGALRNMQGPAVWIPVSARADIARVRAHWLEGSALDLFGRLAPGVSREQAEAIARQAIARTLPDSAARAGIARMAWVRDMHEPAPGNNTSEAYLVFAAISAIGLLILLVTCTNVSSLMVAAAVARRHEIAVRLSLGATRGRILRQLVTETTLLATAGGAAGLLLCWWLVTWLARNEVEGVNITPDVGTVAFMMAVSLGTGILFGLSPALHATRGGAATALKDSGIGTTRQSRLQRAFVVAQIVFSQPLLVLLGVTLSLVIRGYQPLRPEVSERVIRVSFRPLMRTGAPGQRQEAVDSLIPRIAAQPEVTGVVPEATAFTLRKIIEPRAGDAPADTAPTTLHVEGAAPGWFALQDVPILLGRDVSLADTAASKWPVVIGSNLSRTLWGDANPIGRTLPSPAWPGRTDSISMSVVGVYDETLATTRGNDASRVYTAFDKQWRRDVLLVRTRGSGVPFMPALQAFLRAQAPGLPVSRIRTIAQIDEQERLVTLKTAGLAGSAGAVALLLASLGLYGVIALAVQQRTREIGIRIAVGANPARVARMFLASGVRMGAVALALGLPLSLVGLRVAMSLRVVHVPPVNVWLIGGGIAAVLLAVASAATWLPARRAAQVDPAITLRIE